MIRHDGVDCVVFGGYYMTCYVACTYLYSLFVPMSWYINHKCRAISSCFLAQYILRNHIVGKGRHK